MLAILVLVGDFVDVLDRARGPSNDCLLRCATRSERGMIDQHFRRTVGRIQAVHVESACAAYCVAKQQLRVSSVLRAFLNRQKKADQLEDRGYQTNQDKIEVERLLTEHCKQFAQRYPSASQARK